MSIPSYCGEAAWLHIRKPPVAPRRPDLALNKRRQDSAAEILPPRRGRTPHRVLEVRTGRGALGPKTVFPVCAGDWIKPGSGTCSLGQDGLPETSGRP